MAQKRATTKSSAPKSPKRASQPKGGSRSSGSRRTSSRAATQHRPWLSPQAQRELFALFLIGLGVLLIVFLRLTDNPGVIGAGVIQFVQTAFGNGGIIVPILLIVVGALIVWQERFVDAPISGGNIAGVVLLVVVLLGAAEFGGTRNIFENNLDSPSSIGGAIDLLLMQGFGVAGTAVLLLIAFVIGVMLTFNVTLRQIAGKTHAGATGLWNLLIGPKVEEVRHDDLDPEPVPYAEELKTKRQPRPPLNGRTRAGESKPPMQNEDDLQRDLINTPIAGRLTQANLFNRGQGKPGADETAKIEPQRVALANAETQRIEVPVKANGTVETTKAPKTTMPGAVQAKIAEAKTDEADDGVADIDASTSRQAWPLPKVATILDDFSESEIDDNEKRSKARVIEETLASFKIEAQVRDMKVGPAVTQYLLQPAIGVKVSRITGLERDLALALAAPTVRIEAPVPGTPYIGIEIPNSAISSVAMKEVIDTDAYAMHKGKLKLALGRDLSGAPVVTDMTKAPHLLVAGSTGSGKSVAVNSIVCTLLMEYTPDELKFIMVDPKMVELIVYNHIPHLLAPVVTELERVVSLLKWAVKEMERRYKLLAQKGYRNIESYNKAARGGSVGLEPLPYIVIIIDELADLMMMAPDEVETLVCRLAQMARAIGIHLILATQRPSVDVVTGLIKANFPTRMAFAVTSQTDSRVILDQNGAEQLLGRGDMLYLASDAPKPIRVQGTYVSDREIENITRFWRAAGTLRVKPSEQQTNAAPKGLPLKQVDHNTSDGEADAADQRANEQPDAVGVSPLPDSHTGHLSGEEQDELLPKAVQLVRQHERASASLLQRRLRIGYSKAAQLIELLEQQGVVGPAEGGRSREVLHEGDDPLA